MIRIRNQQDFAAGLFLVAFAMLARHLAADLPMGRLVRMGPGYLPIVLAWVLAALGVIIAIRGLTIDGPKLAAWAWRPLMALTASLVCFALLLDRGGLVAAIVVTTLVSSLAAPGPRVASIFLLGLMLSALSTVLFVWLLGLPLTVFPDFG